MPGTPSLDQVYHFIMETFVKRGHAPHYTDLAREFSLNPDEGNRLLHDQYAASCCKIERQVCFVCP